MRVGGADVDSRLGERCEVMLAAKPPPAPTLTAITPGQVEASLRWCRLAASPLTWPNRWSRNCVQKKTCIGVKEVPGGHTPHFDKPRELADTIRPFFRHGPGRTQ